MIFLIGAIIIALIVAFIAMRRSSGKEQDEITIADDCCGAHEVCEADSLLSNSDKIEYYEDEELDVYKNMHIEDYSDEQIEQFREILLTLRDIEVSGWLKSLQLRNINPPEIIREEALMIVADRRFNN